MGELKSDLDIVLGWLKGWADCLDEVPTNRILCAEGILRDLTRPPTDEALRIAIDCLERIARETTSVSKGEDNYGMCIWAVNSDVLEALTKIKELEK